MNSIINFLKANKVLIFGLLLSIILPIYELISKGETSLKVLVVAAGGALTAFLARNLRGQWATIAGIFGTMLATYVTQDQLGHTISWTQIILQGIVLFLTSQMPAAKSIAYEQTPTIMKAKQQAENAVPTIAPPPSTK